MTLREECISAWTTCFLV
jgi:hypothetical protein